MTWTAEAAGGFELDLRDAKARDYDRDYIALHGASLQSVEVRLIHRALNLQKDDVVLDLACGTGRITEDLAASCNHVVAIDRSEQSLAILKDRLARRALSNVTVIKGDARDELRVDRQVSKVVCVQLLQHLPVPADRVLVLQRAAERLPERGKLVVIDEMFGLVRRVRRRPQEITTADSLYFRTFTPTEMRQLVTAAGLRPLGTMGCGVLYWTRYRFARDALIRLDSWASGLPGAAWVAKFGATVAVKD